MSDMTDLARRAVACKGWRWLPGMSDLWGGRKIDGDGVDRMHALPDLTDPATIGCLLALVREAHGDLELHAVCVREDNCVGWVVQRSYLPDGGMYTLSAWFVDTEAEALVAALEAAPC